ncbi:MAG: UvrD-helicase domain-containing protein, partial [Chloroflexi bacterium]|nr:UvrD-helicase domain-containing protein [Chloroflexota bacterium]
MDASRLRSLQPFALSLSGPQLVEASAGTGKTYTIGSLVLRLILEPRPDRVEPPSIDQILVVTFTHAATGELRGRIRERLSEALSQVQGDATCDDVEFSDWLAALAERDPVGCRDRLRAALRDFDDAAIYTIHGFCQRMLQEYAFESGVDFDASLVGDESELRRTAIQDYWANQTYAAPALAVAWLQGPGKLSLDAMEGLGQILAGAPLIERRPPREAVAGPDAAALARLEEAARSAWAEAARAWRQGGPEALEQLARAANAKDLNGGTYKAATILGPWRQQLERSFAAPPMHPDADLTRLLNKLAAGRMRVNQHRSEPEHPFFDACAELVATRESIESSLADWGMALRHGLDAWLARELPERKRRARQQSFDDLLWKLHQALQGSASGAASEQAARLRGRIRSRFRAALIDEFQDTDRIQYQIFQGIFAPELGQGAETADAPPLLLVGDPKQAIYAFRGADIFAYLDAVEQVGEGHRHTLGVNYRSDRSLVEALNRVWRATPRPFLFGQIPFSPVQAQHVDRVTPAEPPLRLAYIPAGVANRDGQARLVGAPAARSASARAAATAIGRLLSEPPTVTRAGAGSSAVTAGDIAVLVRTNAQARLMQRVLRAHQIPCVLFSDASVLEQPEAEELRQILAAIIDPSRARRVRAALVTPALGLSGHAIDALAQDERGWEAWIDDLRRWQDSWRRSGILPALRQLMDEQGVAERLLQLGDGERRLTNLLHLAELLHAVAFQQDLGPEGLLAWFDRARQDEAQLRASLGDTAQLRLESDDAAVKLVTVHKAKGLEYPFVFCPFLWSVTRGAGKGPTRYHALDGGGQQYLDIGPTPSEAGRVAAELEGLAEDLRLLYVAMTRARHGLWLCWGPFFGFEQSALAYLLHAGALDGSAPPGTDQAALVAWRDAVVAEAKAARDRAISAESAAEDPLWRPARDLAAGQAGGIAAERVGDADIRAHGAL